MGEGWIAGWEGGREGSTVIGRLTIPKLLAPQLFSAVSPTTRMSRLSFTRLSCPRFSLSTGSPLLPLFLSLSLFLSPRPLALSRLTFLSAAFLSFSVNSSLLPELKYHLPNGLPPLCIGLDDATAKRRRRRRRPPWRLRRRRRRRRRRRCRGPQCKPNRHLIQFNTAVFRAS